MEKSALEGQLSQILAELRELKAQGPVQKRLYTYDEAALAWAVSKSKVKQMVRHGVVVLSEEIDGCPRIHVSEIERIAKPNGKQKPPKSPGRPRAGRYDLAAELAAAKAITKKR